MTIRLLNSKDPLSKSFSISPFIRSLLRSFSIDIFIVGLNFVGNLASQDAGPRGIYPLRAICPQCPTTELSDLGHVGFISKIAMVLATGCRQQYIDNKIYD